VPPWHFTKPAARWLWLRGQDFVSPALIQELAPDVLRHRIGLTYEAEAEDISADHIVRQVIERTPVPTA
jgi:MoxR-like ATPase